MHTDSHYLVATVLKCALSAHRALMRTYQRSSFYDFLRINILRSWHNRTTDPRMQPDGAEANTGFQSTGQLLLYPLVEDGCAESPDLADLQGTNLPAPRHPLERLGMELQDRCRLARV
jgi:hypothetical protein